ncbi:MULTISPECIES: superoxide dismutase [Cu-Zn] SodC [unclassified Providencia]|uniref:superoxide dismutase [Cu-Zn] SodC n=1 Tax=unclassified Providencia TaxID=2633465 RepID=UPI00234B36A7|nr:MULTISPECIES: superoxide dismutase [Cu-Zn] SodC [unclassified Providencia]ELR5198929.1 superoxide dismutase family protein [Providencia rettgeri]HEM6921137.1 superoxide dismutase family protein [Providencia rettgeri]
MKLKMCLLAALFTAGTAYAAQSTVVLKEATPTGDGKAIGEVVITETEYGLLFTPKLAGLQAGVHGFHVHENPSCEPADKDGKSVPALKAGGHLDPVKTGVHKGPYDNSGHLGDLPGLVADSQGNANYAVLAPRLKSLKDVQERALMVHVGGDNYSDNPEALGGGGARMACGVIK